MLKDLTLLNGKKIPCIGYGTYQSPSNQETINNVVYALKCGYKLIDTASRYGNEREVGKAINSCGLDRKDIFLTTKLWNTEQGYENTLKAFDNSLKELNQEYVDLYLIHWPIPKGHEENWKQLNKETWKAMEEIYKSGKVKAIGVSNFEIVHLENLLSSCNIKPMVNQIEVHPGCYPKELIDYCNKHGIIVEAYAPLVHGEASNNPLLIELSKKYNKSIAQICLRWCLQHNIIPLPKSSHFERILSNFDVDGFEISKEDMLTIDNDHFFHRVFPDPNKGK